MLATSRSGGRPCRLPPHVKWEIHDRHSLVAGKARARRRWYRPRLQGIDTCLHVPGESLHICAWNTRARVGSTVTCYKRREKRCTHLRGKTNSCDILCLQETHGRIEHLSYFEVILEHAVWEKFGCFMPGNVNTGGSILLARQKYLPPDTEIGHHNLRPGRDNFIRIQHEAPCCVVHVHFQPTCCPRSLAGVSRRAWVPSWILQLHMETSTLVIQKREG